MHISGASFPTVLGGFKTGVSNPVKSQAAAEKAEETAAKLTAAGVHPYDAAANAAEDATWGPGRLPRPEWQEPKQKQEQPKQQQEQPKQQQQAPLHRGKGTYRPDGTKIEGGDIMVDGHFVSTADGPHHGLEIEDAAWVEAACNRYDQELFARRHLEIIRRVVVESFSTQLIPQCRWTNDPELFPDLKLLGKPPQCPGVAPFPPHDQQFYVCGIYDPDTSTLKDSERPFRGLDADSNSTWARLTDFAGAGRSALVYDDLATGGHCPTHFGRIFKGALDNGYFAEALQAISLRPKLAQQLFYCWDVERSVFIARLYKHGTWCRIEIDDYVPVGPPDTQQDSVGYPIGVRSEFFPSVLWPSLIEKAYAQIHTTRGQTSGSHEMDRGGWESISGGGQVEDALTDLTGGVSGRFHTCDLSPDRLFIYLYELQRHCLFVCRPHQYNCEVNAVRLNPYYPYAVNRAAVWEGRCYVQVFCGAPSVFDGGLQDVNVPFGLLSAPQYPEKAGQGFFWTDIHDFHAYFDTIIECWLTNSGDVSIPGMPPTSLPPALPFPGQLGFPPQGPGAYMGGPPWAGGFMGGAAQIAAQHTTPDGQPMKWFESVWFTSGTISQHCEPEFTVRVPDHATPCEIVCAVNQTDPRCRMVTGLRDKPVALLLKVYECVDMRYYSNVLVCKSNWIPVRDSMVAFNVRRGGEFRITCEVPDKDTTVQSAIFRCYSSRPGVRATASRSTAKHALVEPIDPARAHRWTFVGAIDEVRLDSLGLSDCPEPLDEFHDTMRKPEFDNEVAWRDLGKVATETCSVM